MPQFTFIIANWNGEHLLADCLASFRNQTVRDFEIIVVDNGSTDGSVEFVRENYREAKLIALPENQGFCKANNEGIRQSSGEWVILVNNDTEIVPDYLAAIRRAMERFPDAGMFASKILFADSPSTIDNCGFTLSRAGTAQEIGRNEPDSGKYELGLEPFGPSGGAAVYRRKLLESVGLLDDDFFLIYEDVDLAMRARLRGFRCYFVPDAVVYHKYRTTLARWPEWQVYYGQRNIELAYLKNMPGRLILRYGVLRVFYNFAGLFYFVRKRLLGSFLAAKFRVVRELPATWRKRRTIQSSRVIAPAEFERLLTPGFLSKQRVKKFLGLADVPSRQQYGS